MKILAWNLNNRVRDAPAQLDRVLRFAADLVVLNEVPGSRLESWVEALGAAGYRTGWTLGRQRAPRAVLLASRAVPDRARTLIAGHAVVADLGPLRVIGVHVPNGGTDRAAKIAALDRLRRVRAARVIVAGDLNAPCEERADGTIVGFGNAAQRAAEERLFAAYQDPFRQLHGYDRAEWSWRSKNGYRLDHVLHRGLHPVLAAYHDHEGLSDHKPVEVRFAAPQPNPPLGGA